MDAVSRSKCGWITGFRIRDSALRRLSALCTGLFMFGFLFFVYSHFSWAYELTSIEWCQRELEIAHDAAVDYNSFMRQICHEVLWKTTGVIGMLLLIFYVSYFTLI